MLIGRSLFKVFKLQMFRRKPTNDENRRLEDFHSFLRAELCKEVRHAIKIVQKESAELQKDTPNDEGQFTVNESSESTKELICLVEACFIHGMNKKFIKMRRKNGTEKFEINIWAVIETVTSKSDQASIKAENKLLKTKTGLARAAIRHFMNNQVLDCYLQGENNSESSQKSFILGG